MSEIRLILQPYSVKILLEILINTKENIISKKIRMNFTTLLMKLPPFIFFIHLETWLLEIKYEKEQSS